MTPSKEATDAASELFHYRAARDQFWIGEVTNIIDRHFADIRQLQAENERLREAGAALADACWYAASDVPADLIGKKCMEALAVWNAAKDTL